MSPLTKRVGLELVLVTIVVFGLGLQVTIGVPQVLQQARDATDKGWELFSFGLPLMHQHSSSISKAIQSRWDALYGDLMQRGWTEQQIFALGTWLTHELVFWGLNGLLYVVYHFDLFAKYKVQPHKFPEPALVKACLKHLAFSQLVAFPMLSYFLYGFFVKTCGVHLTGELPSLARIGMELLFSFVVNETAFYWMHRTLHHKSIYKYIHKQHHQFRVTIGIAAEYANPLEELTANLIPTLMGPLILGSHALVFWFWIGLRLWETIDTHSGYRFPWSPVLLVDGTGRHDFHHSHNVGSFGGSLVFWDWLCGTDRPYAEHMKKRTSLKAKAD